MAKRRYRRYRPDRRRNRKRVPPPTDGWLMPDLCGLFSLSTTTIRRYVKLGMLAHPVFRGRATRYDRETVLRLTAIQQLKLNGYNGLLSLRRALDQVVAFGLERWVTSRPVPQQIADILRPPVAQPTAAPVNAASSTASLASSERPAAVPAASDGGTSHTSSPPSSEPRGVQANQQWETIALLPGLELRLDNTRGAGLRKIATRLCEQVTTLAMAGMG